MKHLTSTLNGIKETFYRNDLWQSIEEMPIHNWIQICETGDLKYCYKKGGRVSPTLEEHWLKLQQQYIDEFGLDENYKQQLRLKKELAILNCDIVITKDKFLNNLVKIKEAEILAITSKEAFKFYEVKDYIEKYKGYRIDPNTTTVIEWYYSLKNMSDGKTD